MSTVRSIERRLYVRRQADRDLTTQAAAAGGEVPRPMEWSSIWTGYMVFAGVGVLLLSLVFGIGFSSLNPLNGSSWSGMGTGTAVWSAIAVLVSLLIGAWVAGRSPHTTRQHGMMRGIALWGLVMISTLLLMGEIGSAAVSATSGVASAALGNATSISAARVTTVLHQNGITLITPAEAGTIATQLMGGDSAGAATTLSTDANISSDRASGILGQVAASAQGAAAGAGRAVKLGGTSVSWGLFWLALIGLGCALLGGAAGASGAELPRHIRPSNQPA